MCYGWLGVPLLGISFVLYHGPFEYMVFCGLSLAHSKTFKCIWPNQGIFKYVIIITHEHTNIHTTPIVIEDYYHMTTMMNVNWMKPTHLLSNFSPNLRALLYIYFYFIILITSLLKMSTLKKINTSHVRIICTLVHQTMPLLILILVCIWYEESTPMNLACWCDNKTCTKRSWKP